MAKQTKAIVIYGSTTGNTETLSAEVAKGLRNGGMEVTVMDVRKADVKKLTDFGLIVLGCSTWGEGELQDDFVDFYNAMSKESFEGKKTAVFGPGDSEMYPDCFCEAVVMIEKKLRECNAEVVAESLKIDGDIEPALGEAQSWGLSIAKAFYM
jgi:flavodoxin I